MGSDRSRSDVWLTVLLCTCAVLAVAAVLLELRLAESDGPPRSPSSTTLAGPAADTVAIPANQPAAIEAAARRGPRDEPEPAPPNPPPPKPYAAVKDGAEVAIRKAPAGAVVASAGDETEFGSPTIFSVDRVRGRWLGVSTADLPNGRLGWLRADPDKITRGFTDFRIAVDLSDHEARLRKGAETLRRWEVTVGGPDSPTPTGEFAVTDVFRGGLNPAYGCCAVALSATQPNLPAGWDGGDRIAIHGTDGPLGVDASTGCVRSRDRDVRALVDTVPLGTPVTIRP